MAGTHINDAGTWRKLKRIFMNDAGTWRTIRKAYVNDAGTWRTVFTAGDEFTLVAGQNVVGPTTIRGYNPYSNGGPGGTLTPSSLSDGKLVVGITDVFTTGLNYFQFTLFSANVGASFLDSITIGSTTYLGAAAGYSFVINDPDFGTVATWQWNSAPFGFVNGQSYGVVVAHA